MNAIQALSQLSYTPIFCFCSPPLPDDFCIIAHNLKMSSSFFDFFHFLFSGKNRPGKGKLGLPFSALCVYNERQQKYINKKACGQSFGGCYVEPDSFRKGQNETGFRLFHRLRRGSPAVFFPLPDARKSAAITRIISGVGCWPAR